ncbi:MAG TPA: hypothetical protein VGO96_13545 [Pyrinomonadaceae bacterium]|nr:hypothetical protein [Pyrinomonadaceae bacterium]
MKRPQLTTHALCLLMLLGVTLPHAPQAVVPGISRARGAAARTARAPQAQLRCTPRRLRRGDTLTLSMQAGHGGYLAIVNPDGKYFFLTSADEGARAFEKNAGVSPFISATDFSRMRQLRLSTADTKAIDYEGSQEARRAETVFRQVGWYKVLISDTSLERDEPSPEGQCKVYYAGNNRQGR